MSAPDPASRNRRGCFLMLGVVLAVLAIFLFLYLAAPANERQRSIANGQAPVGTVS